MARVSSSSLFVYIYFFWRNSGDRGPANRSVIRVECVPRTHERAGDDRGRRDEKSCRWVQIDDVNGPPASRGGWLVEVKCECVHVEERRG